MATATRREAVPVRYVTELTLSDEEMMCLKDVLTTLLSTRTYAGWNTNIYIPDYMRTPLTAIRDALKKGV